ncbi:hypothetical protein [Streptomyces nigrescens]|uniref:hypothetical protein n=1 Tax=Streptomyces nigrescens TaxID=1920 RepID=UPI0036F8A4D1
MTVPVPESLGHLRTLLEGLVPLHMMRLNRPGELSRAHQEAEGLGDVIAETGDRLTASGNFRSPSDRAARRQVLNAIATCLALGAHQPGGVTWAGAHWCTAPHPNCPNAQQGAA